MSIQVYEMAHSPYCIPITQALTAFGIDFDRVSVPNWDRGEVIRLTQGAYYQVPVLRHDEKVVYETSSNSLDIARYVDLNFAEGRLFPREYAGIHEIAIDFIENDLELLTFKLVDPSYCDSIDNIENRIQVIRHKERRFGRGCVDEWKNSKPLIRAKADELLTRFQAALMTKPFLFGETPIYADFALYGIIGNMTYQGWNELGEAQSDLKDWAKRVENYRF